jgi:exosortase
MLLLWDKGADMTRKPPPSIWQFGCGQSFFCLVFVGLFLVAFLPVISGLVGTWAHFGEYSHGFLISPLAAYILWLKREALFRTPVRGSWSGLLVATGSLLVYVVAYKAEMQTIASASMVLFLCGAVIFLFGYTIFRICSFPLLILFFMIPVPAQIIATLTIPLQLIVTRASVWLASMIGIPIHHEGNVIYLPQGTFEVVQACSGLRSIMAMLTLGVILAYLTLRSNLIRAILLLLAIPIAIAVNIIRVFMLIAVFYFLEIDLSKGTIHAIFGVAVFGMAFGLFLLAGKGLALCER